MFVTDYRRQRKEWKGCIIRREAREVDYTEYAFDVDLPQLNPLSSGAYSAHSPVPTHEHLFLPEKDSDECEHHALVFVAPGGLLGKSTFGRVPVDSFVSDL